MVNGVDIVLGFNSVKDYLQSECYAVATVGRVANRIAGGRYDHNYLLNSEYAARAESVRTGISLEVYTDMPCMQFYTGGALKPCRDKTMDYNEWEGFCLEPQYCPNAINTEGFEGLF